MGEGSVRQKSDLKPWIGIGVAIIALLVSSLSFYVSWKSFTLKQEYVTSLVEPNMDCNAQYTKLGREGVLGLCWIATVTNSSEDKASIVRGEIFNLDNGVRLLSGDKFRTLEGPNGAAVDYPIILDGGEAKKFLVRAPVQVPASVARVIDDLLLHHRRGPHARLSLYDVQNALAVHGLDFLGDKIDVIRSGGQISGWALKPSARSTINVWRFQTGRGMTFAAELRWPPAPE